MQEVSWSNKHAIYLRVVVEIESLWRWKIALLFFFYTQYISEAIIIPFSRLS